MPIYVYQNEQNEEIEVIRSIKDCDVPPTEEETEGKKGPWKKILGNTSIRRSNNWGWGKGYYNNQTPDKRIP